VSVVIGAETVAYGGSGAVLDGWPVSLGQVGPVSLADINGDGLDEIFWGCADSQLWAYQADGTPLPGWPPPLGGSGYTPHIADLDVDGDLEIVTLDSPSAARWRLAPRLLMALSVPLSATGRLGQSRQKVHRGR